jgi:hypothetical protein
MHAIFLVSETVPAINIADVDSLTVNHNVLVAATLGYRHSDWLVCPKWSGSSWDSDD